MLSALGGTAGFPDVHYFGQQDVLGAPRDVLVMELLGPSVEDLCWRHTGGTRFDPPTVRRIGRELLPRLQALHKLGYVHNDIKASNILLGCPDAGSDAARAVHLVDFGVATRPDEAQAAEGSLGDSLVGAAGTPLFASEALHAGRPTTYADDLESLAYVLVYLSKGSLPWMRVPPESAAAMKRALRDDGWRDKCPMSMRDAVSALWDQATRDEPIDYNALAEPLESEATDRRWVWEG